MSEEILLGRQPVLDRSGALVAYELLFRDADEAGPASGAEGPTDGLRASSQVMAGALIDIGLADSLGPHVGFVNANHLLLMDDVVSVLPPERFVLEVLETTAVDDPLRARLAELRGLGYRLALDESLRLTIRGSRCCRWSMSSRSICCWQVPTGLRAWPASWRPAARRC